MRRVVVIGSGGAGKSTFARRLGEVTGLPVIHLDSLYWKPNWEKTPVDEWETRVRDLARGESWIMDGNFGGTRELRISAADTVVFLDIPRLVCLYRVAKRILKYYGKSRPDMAPGCREMLDLEFIRWVWNYPVRSRAKVMDDMRAFPDKEFVVLRSSADAEAFLRGAVRRSAN